MLSLDFRVDLPKVRAAYEAKTLQAQTHAGKKTLPKYAGPCAIGVLLPEDLRERLDRKEYSRITTLLASGALTAPDDQHEDWGRLQIAHDQWKRTQFDHFLPVLEELEAKYAS